MKQITTFKNALSLVAALTLFSSFSYAGNIHASKPRFKTSFQHDFKHASLIGTEVHDNIIRVTFSMDNTIRWAYYSVDGRLLGVVHNILSTQLPDDLQGEIKEQYGNYWITELFQVSKDGDSCYYVSLQNADETVNLRSTPDQGWEVYSIVKKG